MEFFCFLVKDEFVDKLPNSPCSSKNKVSSEDVVPSLCDGHRLLDGNCNFEVGREEGGRFRFRPSSLRVSGVDAETW